MENALFADLLQLFLLFGCGSHEMLPEHGLESSKNAPVLESHIFRKARTKDEYLKLVAKLSMYYQNMAHRKSEQQQ